MHARPGCGVERGPGQVTATTMTTMRRGRGGGLGLRRRRLLARAYVTQPLPSFTLWPLGLQSAGPSVAPRPSTWPDGGPLTTCNAIKAVGRCHGSHRGKALYSLGHGNAGLQLPHCLSGLSPPLQLCGPLGGRDRC